MKQQRKPFFYRLIQSTVRKLYIKYTVEERNAPVEGGRIYVSNHAQIHGPIAHQLYFPRPKKIWVIGEMCNRKEAGDYAMKDFWPFKKKSVRWFYYLFSHLIISWLGPYLFTHADTIAVYKDIRLKQTMNQTVEALDCGEDVVIFPEHGTPHNRYLNEFLLHFVDVARRFHKVTGKPLSFYPVYTCPELKKIIIGQPIQYEYDQIPDQERLRIIGYLQTEITRMADELPNHTIIPYANIDKKKRQKSKEDPL